MSALPALVRIGNAPSSQSGDYINTDDLANTLAITSVTILSEGVVRVEDPSNLSVSTFFGPTLFDLFLQGPTRVEVLGDLTMGAGSVGLTAPEVRLEGILRDSGGSPLDASRLASSATSFVVGSGGSVDQASWMASENPTPPITITVDGASDANLVNVWNNVRLELRSGFVENLTLLASGSQVDWRGGQIGETGLFGFGGTIRIYGSQFERGPSAVCASLPPSSWTAAPASLTNVGACLRGRLESGETFLVNVNVGGTIEFIEAGPPAAVPGPGLWLVPVLAQAGWLFQRRIGQSRAAVDRASARAS
ncbi:MAG: hypothetical protein IPK00_14945 [Deltaproteobacteria bacterium]|nr:hypothetical protein [Deltaproteobacteria bacterium]